MLLKVIGTILGVTFFLSVFSQQPVRWKYSIKKIGNKIYEIHFTATIDRPWHIYSQDSNEDLGMPTKFTFFANPLLSEENGVKEVGIIRKEVLDNSTIKYYEKGVDFIQRVRVKAEVKISIRGTISFMACTSTHCLRPEKRSFNLDIGGGS